MNELKLGAVDARFAQIVWDHAPMTTGELIRQCAQELQWKRTTTYTVLRKFCDNGIFRCENGRVSVLIGRDELRGMQSARFVDEVFGGSLPTFIAAFANTKKLTQEEVQRIREMIDKAGEE